MNAPTIVSKIYTHISPPTERFSERWLSTLPNLSFAIYQVPTFLKSFVTPKLDPIIMKNKIVAIADE